MFHRQEGYSIDYENGSFADEIRKEVSNNTQLGNLIKNDLNKKGGFLKQKYQKKIWLQILNRAKGKEYLFLTLSYSKEVFDSLLKSAKELGLENKMVLNLFLSEDMLKKKAKAFFENHKSTSSTSEELYLKRMLDWEHKRLAMLSEIRGLIDIVNIDSDFPKKELEAKVLKEIQ